MLHGALNDGDEYSPFGTAFSDLFRVIPRLAIRLVLPAIVVFALLRARVLVTRSTSVSSLSPCSIVAAQRATTSGGCDEAYV